MIEVRFPKIHIDCSFEIDLGNVSLILNNENQNNPCLSFSGRADDSNNPMKIPKLPSNGTYIH